MYNRQGRPQIAQTVWFLGLDEEEDAAGSWIEEFDQLDISDGIDDIADEDFFDEEVVDEGNIFNRGGLWLLYNTIWYYTILYNIIPHSPRRFQLYRTVVNTYQVLLW